MWKTIIIIIIELTKEVVRREDSRDRWSTWDSLHESEKRTGKTGD